VVLGQQHQARFVHVAAGATAHHLIALHRQVLSQGQHVQELGLATPGWTVDVQGRTLMGVLDPVAVLEALLALVAVECNVLECLHYKSIDVFVSKGGLPAVRTLLVWAPADPVVDAQSAE